MQGGTLYAEAQHLEGDIEDVNGTFSIPTV
jgi:hypothetical protein